MLSVDHVRARRRGHQLELIPISAAVRARLLQLAERYIYVFKMGVGQDRESIDEACDAIPISGSLQKLSAGLRKLLIDRSTFSGPEGCDPVSLRRSLFQAAAKLRSELPDGERLDRDEALAVAATESGVDRFRIEELLFADLKSAWRLENFETLSPAQLLEEYELAQAQAILLRATSLDILMRCDDPSDYRAIFRALKFRRLLFELREREDGSYQLLVDGPHQLFRLSTRYGLQLALLLPTLRACQWWRLSAKVSWGRERQPLDFYLNGEKSEEAPSVDLVEELVTLMERFKKLKSPWRVRRANKIINLPGVGLCIPDLIFVHEDKSKIYFEALGYWSRDAVWRRVELVEEGLAERLIFAVSERLRVSERALNDELPSTLYVYKGVISPRELLRRLEKLHASKGGEQPE